MATTTAKAAIDRELSRSLEYSCFHTAVAIFIVDENACEDECTKAGLRKKKSVICLPISNICITSVHAGMQNKECKGSSFTILGHNLSGAAICRIPHKVAELVIHNPLDEVRNMFGTYSVHTQI